jgi:ribosomal protein S18 acetylase RimI-like enzyme
MDADNALTLRHAMPSDRAFLVALYASTRAAEFAHLGWPVEMERTFMKMQFDAQRGDFECRHPGAPCQIVEQHRCPIGRLWVAQDARRVTVLDISMVTETRGQGIGTACLRRVLRRAEAAGLDVELQVVCGNPAQRLYERLGFRTVAEGGVRLAMVWKPPRTGAAARPVKHPQEMHHEQA